MIAAKNDDGVVVKAASPQRIKELPDAVINIANGSVIGSTGPLNLVLGKVCIPQVTNLQQPLAVGVLVFLGDLDLGQGNVYTLVEVPVLLLNIIRIVGVGKRDL